MLDLHGKRHDDAKRLLEKALNRLWCSGEDLEIVTGNSAKMKEIVVDVLKEYKLTYKVGDFSGQNMGYVTTTLD